MKSLKRNAIIKSRHLHLQTIQLFSSFLLHYDLATCVENFTLYTGLVIWVSILDRVHYLTKALSFKALKLLGRALVISLWLLRHLNIHVHGLINGPITQSNFDFDFLECFAFYLVAFNTIMPCTIVTYIRIIIITLNLWHKDVGQFGSRLLLWKRKFPGNYLWHCQQQP